MVKSFFLPLLCGAALWVAMPASGWTQTVQIIQTAQVLDLHTRPGVAQRLLLIQPADSDVRASVVLMVGRHRGLQLNPAGSLRWGAGNFLARSRGLFAARGLAIALVEAPSDRQNPPYSSGFRQSPEHAVDVKAVIAEMRQRFGKPVVLVGTSRGTQSVAAVALQLRDADGPDGLVLTASILKDPTSRALPEMPLAQLTLPILVVHHEQDGCGLCLDSDLDLLTAPLKAPLTVRRNTTGEPCEAMSHHGFNGLETNVVQDIADWIGVTVVR
jgi:hypothetical protein